MAQPLGQLIAVHHAAHLAACRAACRQDDPVGGEACPGLSVNGKGIPLLFQSRHHAAGAQVNGAVLQREAQHVQHAARHVAEGVDTAAVLGGGHKAAEGKPVQRILHGEGLQREAAEIRLLSVIVWGSGMAVGEVAPAVAGGQQLAAHTGLPLQQRHRMAVLRRCQRRHHAGGAAADHQYLHDCASSRLRVR